MTDSSRLLTALDFWEEYPLHLEQCRAVIGAIDRHRDTVFLCCEAKLVHVSVEGFGITLGVDPIPRLGFKLGNFSFQRDAVRRGFSEVGLKFGEPGSNSPAYLTAARLCVDHNKNFVTEILVHEMELIELHQQAEGVLCSELERRGMDGSTIVVSGRVCRAISAGVIDPQGRRNCSKPQKVFWPSAAGDLLNTLHPTNIDAVMQAERSLIRLRTQLNLDSMPACQRPRDELVDAATTPEWSFEPGKAIYKGKTIPVNGIRWKLLRALAEAKRTLTVDELRDAGWEHDAEVEVKTIRTHLSAIRAALRKKLGLPSACDPIPRKDRGTLLAWGPITTQDAASSLRQTDLTQT